MVVPFDAADWLAALCAITAASLFAAMAAAIGRGAARQRCKRRLNLVRDRARGIPVAAAAARQLVRPQSTTPKIDRLARLGLPAATFSPSAWHAPEGRLRSANTRC